MYVDKPSPDAAALAIPVLLTVFFTVVAITISSLALFFLPPVLWMFAVPVLLICVVCAGIAWWYARSLFRLRYEISSGRLTIRRDGGADVIYLADLETAFQPPRGESRAAAGADHSGVHSARAFANRSDTLVLLKAGGEWLRLSPSDPAAFLRALERKKSREDEFS